MNLGNKNTTGDIELSSKSNFELQYEFVLWDYRHDKLVLDQIKDEIKSRKIKGELIRFVVIAFMFNLGSLFPEAVYSDRWDFFEIKGRRSFWLMVSLFILKMVLIYLLLRYFSRAGIVWKIISLAITGILSLPHIYKTIIDIRNYMKANKHK